MKRHIPFVVLIYGFVSMISGSAQSSDTVLFQAKQLYKQNNYSFALEKYFEVLKQAEIQKDDVGIINASLSLARCYYFLNDRGAAFKWSYNALRIAEKQSFDSLLIEPNYFLGALHIEDGNVDSAEKYSYETIRLAKKYNYLSRVSQTYSTLAEMHLNTSRDRTKIEYMISNAEKFAKESKNDAVLAFAYSKRYNYAFFLKKDYEDALLHINKAEKIYAKTGNREAILNAYRAKAECLIMLRDTSARSYMLKWFAFKDSAFQVEKAENVAKFEVAYESERKEKENQILKQQNQLTRLWLIITGTAFLLMFVSGLWFFNNHRLKKKQNELLMIQKLQQEKERIARDLHDHVGGQLFFINYSLDGILNENLRERQELKESLNETVHSVIVSLRETIWAISDEKISVVDFSDKLKVFARRLFKHSKVKVNYLEEFKTHRELNSWLGLNLYRISQEILNNTFKYAKANEVHIHLICESDKVTLKIKDDGIGFDISKQKEGYGLQNIRKRTENMGIIVNFKTKPDEGTEYQLIV